jgi:Spy/CpxP family protein refolding chaperone
MRRSRLILPSFVALSLMAGAATAQQSDLSPADQASPPPSSMAPPPPGDNPPPGPGGPGMKDLNLSPQQKEQVRQIFQEERQQTHERLSQVLTPAQMAQWDAHMKAHMNERRQGPMMQRGDMPGQPGQEPAPPSSTP